MSQPGGSDIGCWESGAKEAEERSANEFVKNGLAAVGSSAGGNADQMVFINVRIFCYPILHLAVLKKAEQTPSIAFLIYAKSIGKQPPQFFIHEMLFRVKIIPRGLRPLFCSSVDGRTEREPLLFISSCFYRFGSLFFNIIILHLFCLSSVLFSRSIPATDLFFFPPKTSHPIEIIPETAENNKKKKQNDRKTKFFQRKKEFHGILRCVLASLSRV